jgi:glutamyl-tRNA synthetase
MFEDMKWFGLHWDEGPDIGGRFGPYRQSERHEYYIDAWEKLRCGGFVYPCSCSRRDVSSAVGAPHSENDEPIYPGTCRLPAGAVAAATNPAETNWRFRVPDAARLRFVDQRLGEQSAIAGKDFGDFIVWRKDDVPAYQLAVVVDDAAMQITEVVRGADLITSTFRQLLLYRALGLEPPQFYHAPLILDSLGNRLAKRHASLTLRALRAAGANPESLRAEHFTTAARA